MTLLTGVGRALILLIALLLIYLPPARAADLTYAVGMQGLDKLDYRGQALLADGLPRVVNWGPRFRKPDGTVYDAHEHKGIETPIAGRLDRLEPTLTQTFSWGKLACHYSQKSDHLFLRVRVDNSSPDTITSVDVQLLELNFPGIPQGDTADPGMFGTGGPHPLHDYPLTANPKNSPGVISVDFGASGTLAFCNEAVTNPVTLSVPYSTNQPTDTRYPFWVSLGPILPGKSQTATVSLRFGPPGASVSTLAGDLYQRYAKAYPYTMHWNDRRAIGTNFLATSEAHPPKNPRGWFTNAKDVDTTTEEGRAEFRRRLLAYADSSVKILKAMNAQGMITWDPEGEEFGQSTYYGDPRLVTKLAPEMEDKDKTGVATVDAYFRKFAQAGLRVGICIRPQQIAFVNGAPVQQDSLDPAKTLAAKIAYAKQRWGCTLFYVDSTVDAHSPLSPDVFVQVARQYPDVLLMPENQTTRYYACTAPFDSFYHHGVASTPAGVCAVYPPAFSALYVVDDGQNGTIAASHDRLLAAVKRGDILLFHGWYDADGNAKIKHIYEEARGPLTPSSGGTSGEGLSYSDSPRTGGRGVIRWPARKP